MENRVYSGLTYVGHTFTSFILGSLSFVCALSWNSAIQNSIQMRFPEPADKKSRAEYSLYSAIGLTIATIVLIYASSFLNHGKGLNVPLERYYMGG